MIFNIFIQQKLQIQLTPVGFNTKARIKHQKSLAVLQELPIGNEELQNVITTNWVWEIVLPHT
jgi:hypothetical protein